tara:strand:+ start:33345 stop:33731 length:387 start_codon:yes stop_codon:yes gene_type:complete
MEAVWVLLAGIINFILGGLWYALLGKQWMSAWGISEKDINRKDPTPYLIAFIGSLWAAYGLFLVIKHIQPKNIEELLTIGVGAWLLLFVGMGAKHYAFAGKSLNAFLIDYGLDLIGFIVMSLIIWNIS